MKVSGGKCGVLRLGRNHATHQVGGWPAGKQPCGEGPGSPCRQQVKREPAKGPCGQEGQWDPGVALGRVLPARQVR